MNDSLAVRKWVFDKLKSNNNLVALLAAPPPGCALNVYEVPSPMEAASPLITIQQIPGTTDTRHGDDSFAMSEIILLIKAVVDGNAVADLHNIEEQINVSLDGVAGTQGNWQIIGRRRESFSSPVYEDGKLYRQAGGRYAFLLRPAY